MDVVITITGKVTIADDDLKSVRAQKMEDLATMLYRHGKDVKTGVTPLIESGQVEVKMMDGSSEFIPLPVEEKTVTHSSPIAKKPSKKRRTRRAKKGTGLTKRQICGQDPL